MRRTERAINRSQALVLGFFAFVVAAVVAILAYDPSVYTRAMHPAPGQATAVEIAFLVALIMLISFIALGVVRRWRWMFWLILIAFLAGFLRVPASTLELLRVIPNTEPSWYVVLQGVIGLVQFGIGLALLNGYRKEGVWGDF